MMTAASTPALRTRGTRGWTAGAAVAGMAVGLAIGSGSRAGTLAAAALVLAPLLLLPLSALVPLALAVCVTYRLAAPTATGPLSAAPDAVLALTFLRACLEAATVERRHGMPGVRRIAVPVVLIVATGAAASIATGDHWSSLLVSLRQFLRLPLWALALSLTGITWRAGRTAMWTLLILSLVQAPLAVHQYLHPPANLLPGVHFYRGDNVSGTFGFAGSNTEMVFLVMAAAVWTALALVGSTPMWSLWVAAPLMILPMALGSAAAFVLLLPAAVLAVSLRVARSRAGRLRMGALLAGLVLVGLVAWSARSFALAPGFAGSDQQGATALLSPRYLGRYLLESDAAGSRTRIGFLHLAIGADLRGGPKTALLGLGPSAAAIGPLDAQISPDRSGVLTTASVQSLPRLLLGFGAVGVVLFTVLVLLPVSGLARRRPRDRTAAALMLALPVVAGIYLLAGAYNAPWTDPGVAAGFWGFVLAAHAGLLAPAGELRGARE
jgi:hypothetical protein